MKKGKMGSRLKAKVGKSKKWKKGHSCVTNPESKQHRQAAKNRFFNVNTGPSNLTVEALAQHDAGQSEVGSEEGSVTHTLGGRSFATWATNWTECTNATFSRVLRYANSSIHKEILAVLAAITEVIKSKGGQETETEYFAALMTTLESVEEAESLAAACYLLSLVIKKVPVSVIKLRFSEVSKVLLEQLGKHADSSTPALLRSLLRCLAHVLRVQELAIWSNSSTLQIYNSLLVFASHTKPKVRKAGQQAVLAVLKDSTFLTNPDSPAHHPAAVPTAKHCIRQIEACGGTGEATLTLHMLGLMKDVLPILPQQSLKSCCETMLRLMTLSNVIVTSLCMKALHSLFMAVPASMPAQMNAQLITALYDYQPGDSDVQPCLAWLAVMEQAHSNLAKLDGALCVGHLPRVIGSMVRCMASERHDVAKAAAKSLEVVLYQCVVPTLSILGQQSATSGSLNPVNKIFSAIEGGLSYKYHGAWDLVLKTLSVTFQVLGKDHHTIMMKCLASLADLRDSHEFAFITELDRAVGSAVSALGPQCVLNAIPLQVTGNSTDNMDFPRSWLLPVFRDYTHDTELGFYTSYFLPLAAKLRQRSAECASQQETVKARTYDVLQSQIWSLLPGFCTRPTDLKQSFSGIARILGSAITEKPDIRMEVMSSLRKLVNHNLDNEENRKELSRFSKNFLPILFNVITTETEKGEREPSRLAANETAGCYLTITDTALVEELFTSCQAKLSDNTLSTFKRHALMDLIVTMVPFVTQPILQGILPRVIEQLDHSDKTIQKKSYRFLEELCSGKSEQSLAFMAADVGLLQRHLLASLSSSSPSSKAPRLRCLLHILQQQKDQQMDFVSAVISEAVLCTRETAEKARNAAYTLLLALPKAMMEWNPNSSSSDVLKEYLGVLMAGLAGSPHLTSCTILALTRILYEFKAALTSEILSGIVDSNCLLLTSKSREVVTSALGLTKTLLVVADTDLMAQFLKTIVTSLVSMKEDGKHHVRFRPKEIFVKLVRKFGYEAINSMVPATHQKMISNIRKTQERTKRRKQNENVANQELASDDELEKRRGKSETFEDMLRDTDSELEEDTDDKHRKQKTAAGNKAGRQKRDGAAWLREGNADDVMDFLDPSVAKKVLATKPGSVLDGKKRAAAGKDEFKMASDGRLIITEESDDEGDVRKGKTKNSKGAKAMEIDDIDELLDAMGGPSKNKNKKRKLGDLEEEEAPSTSKYKAGGRGIHRPIQQSVEQEPGSEYKAKKAKGDMKKKGKPDPFAYVPLDFKQLNRRKKAKSSGRFTNLVKGAKKGADRGSKLKPKRK